MRDPEAHVQWMLCDAAQTVVWSPQQEQVIVALDDGGCVTLSLPVLPLFVLLSIASLFCFGFGMHPAWCLPCFIKSGSSAAFSFVLSVVLGHKLVQRLPSSVSVDFVHRSVETMFLVGSSILPARDGFVQLDDLRLLGRPGEGASCAVLPRLLDCRCSLFVRSCCLLASPAWQCWIPQCLLPLPLPLALLPRYPPTLVWRVRAATLVARWDSYPLDDATRRIQVRSTMPSAFLARARSSFHRLLDISCAD